MHEMQSILTDVRGVCQYVCHVAHLGFTVQKLMAEQIKMLFGVSTPGGPWNIVLKVDPDPHREGEGTTFKFWDPHPIYGTAEARDLKFCLHVERLGS